MTDTVKFQLGDIVYLRLSPEETGMVTGVLFRPHGHLYYVMWCDEKSETVHYEMELTADKEFKPESV